ncbi:MAG: PHP domain-containing protein [Comamonadaceae bacterium]|nr:PHP domain-containing protein [Comamonadaceae bacterium]
MAAPAFVHLRLHSEYSIVDGLTRIDAAVDRAAADAMPALALTDLANLFGMVKFYTAARGKGVKPIIGCDVWIADEADARRAAGARALLLAQNRAGYLQPVRTADRAPTSATRSRGRAEISRDWFARATPTA